MDELSEMDKSKMRIAALIIQHCSRFRLLDSTAGDVPVVSKLRLVGTTVDFFEGELLQLRSGNDSEPSGVEASGGKARNRKQSVCF
ncbi:hypothetical protein [Roseovarius indicus]|uniref:hypothetical protein n=1 Tax=Roseovarius indicus TaxID=540747 RepID=UPI0015A5882B|nr:hypothetical protein [Roseovarius indicus]